MNRSPKYEYTTANITANTTVRISNPCDTCAVRRVKCGIERPCHECRKRGLECTSLRTKRKRGPKGPRQSTIDRVRGRLCRRNIVTPTSTSADDRLDSACTSVRNYRPPLSAYQRFIEIFRTRLYPIWPVISPEPLIANLVSDQGQVQGDETSALAAALCAATISQLRLDEHTNRHDGLSSLTFALEAERLRTSYDYRENCSLSSLLTAFFLHMYYSNAGKLRTAALLLREAITCCHLLELHRPGTMAALSPAEQSLRVRVYWLLLISELTFSAQNGLPTIMQPIDAIPQHEDDQQGADLHAFTSLTHLFSFLRTPARTMIADGTAKEAEGTELAAVQAKLASDGDDAALNETQRVDLCVTRQWIRVLTWEYMTRHFPMSRRPDDPAFSLLLPVQIGREVLSFFATVDPSFILAHGYGMELKVFRVADAIMDIMMCAPEASLSDGMVLGAGDVLSSLQRVIFMVGGSQSDFFGRLQRRLGTLGMSALAPYRVLPVETDVPEIASGVDDGNAKLDFCI